MQVRRIRYKEYSVFDFSANCEDAGWVEIRYYCSQALRSALMYVCKWSSVDV